MSEVPLSVDVVSDVVCPWCYIGKRRLERALTLIPDVAVTVRFNPYFLNPWVPRAGMSRTEYLITKFGSVERYKEIGKRVSAAAAQEGLIYDLDKIARQPNTLDCHRLILWAGEDGDPARMKQRLMELYFADGADLSDPEVLVRAAVECGLDGDRIRALLATDTDVARVTETANAAKEAGIDGVPCFIFGGVLAVSGAQRPEVLADAITRAAAETAKPETASAG